MRILYRHPDTCHAERRYIASWLVEEIFGAELCCEAGDLADQRFQVEGERGELVLPDTFFALAHQGWLGPESLPQEPLSSRADGLPVLYGDGDAVDVPGSLFFLLSRYEEVVVPDRDQHGRFPSGASVLAREQLLHRAIGNEYIELFWSAIRQVWPGLKRKPREFRLLPSHDIDHPSEYWVRWADCLRRSLRRARRGQVRDALRYFGNRLGYGRWIHWKDDPADTISWLVETANANGVKSAFNYIPEKTHRRDLAMPLDHPHVEDQWRRIAAGGHEVGVHPGYGTLDQPEKVWSAAKAVRRQMERLEIRQEILGGRQHFLRWKTPDSARAWEQAGLDYDSTLGFIEQAGFRCGICYEYPLYDVVNRAPLRVRERPLVVMDRTVIDEDCMGLGRTEQALEFMLALKKECRKYNGDFTVLWHNDRFVREDERKMFKALLAA